MGREGLEQTDIWLDVVLKRKRSRGGTIKHESSWNPNHYSIAANLSHEPRPCKGTSSLRMLHIRPRSNSKSCKLAIKSEKIYHFDKRIQTLLILFRFLDIQSFGNIRIAYCYFNVCVFNWRKNKKGIRVERSVWYSKTRFFIHGRNLYIYIFFFFKIIFFSFSEIPLSGMRWWKIEIRVDPARKSFLGWNGMLCKARDLFDAIWRIFY